MNDNPVLSFIVFVPHKFYFLVAAPAKLVTFVFIALEATVCIGYVVFSFTINRCPRVIDRLWLVSGARWKGNGSAQHLLGQNLTDESCNSYHYDYSGEKL